tara:strand:+ start:563 stop:1741 length:1179 start_codon:yes stop_codon:yes gene_type:complete
MNRPLIITIGIVVILFVLGLWVYLLLFGTPNNSGEVFSNLGFKLSPQEVTITPPVADVPLPETTVDTTGEALRQLTTRPVAGFIFINTASSSMVRYAERGTGYIYEIDLTTGKEESLSRTTIPQVAEAVFSPSGDTVALTSYNQYVTSVFVGTLGEEINLEGIQLQPGAENISFASDEDVLYTVGSNGTTKGYRHNITTQSRSEVFSFNYSNIDVGWGSNLDDIYIATKPSQNLEGYIYKTENNTLTPITPPARGLSALYSNNNIITTFVQSDKYKSVSQSSNGARNPLPILALKEKCDFDVFAKDYVWCAAPATITNADFAEDWYKGITTSNDLLWLVNIPEGEAQLYANFQDLSGRIIDVSEIAINSDGTALSFTNKLDHTLWLYALTAE